MLVAVDSTVVSMLTTSSSNSSEEVVVVAHSAMEVNMEVNSISTSVVDTNSKDKNLLRICLPIQMSSS